MLTVSEENKTLWNEACALIIESSSSPERVSSLLSDAVLEQFDDRGIILAFSNAMKKSGIDRSYIDDIKDSLFALTNKEMDVTTTIDKDAERPKPTGQVKLATAGMPSGEVPFPNTPSGLGEEGTGLGPNVGQMNPPAPSDPLAPAMGSPVPSMTANQGQPATGTGETVHKLDTYNLKFTFENFVVGESNNLPFSAARAVAERPGSANRNPLFIYGHSGLGKTHLLCAINNYILQNYPNMKTLYVQSKDIVDDIVNASGGIKGKGRMTWEDFYQKYYPMDVILVDDIQFLENKEESTEQVFQIFNKFIDHDKQVVISSDRAPREINMDERMLSRFNHGLTVDIQPPTFEMKLGIIKQFAKNNFPEMVLSEDVYNYIVEISNSNIRDIEGAMKKIGYHYDLFGNEIDRNLAQTILKDHFPDKNSKYIDISFIQKEVEKKYDISHEEMIGPKRERKINNPRQIAMYLSREMTNASFPEIGRKFKRDHTTIMHGVDNIERQMKQNPVFYNEIQSMMENIRDKA